MSEAATPTPQTAERSYGGQTREYRTGDILLLSGTKYDSWIIRFATKSAYSHAGIVYVWNGPDENGATDEGPSTRSVPRVYCLEARGVQGVRLCLLSRLIQDKHYERIVYYRGNQLTAEQRNKAIGFAFRQLGSSYDHGAIRRFALYIFLIMVGLRKRLRPTPTPKRKAKTKRKMEQYRRNDQWFCSELVAGAYKHAGLDIALPPELISPEDLVHLGPPGTKDLFFSRSFQVSPEVQELSAGLDQPLDAR